MAVISAYSKAISLRLLPLTECREKSPAIFKASIHRLFEGQLKTVTITKTPTSESPSIASA